MVWTYSCRLHAGLLPTCMASMAVAGIIVNSSAPRRTRALKFSISGVRSNADIEKSPSGRSDAPACNSHAQLGSRDQAARFRCGVARHYRGYALKRVAYAFALGEK